MPARCLLILLFLTPLLSLASAEERADFFETHVRPLLVEHCVECHGPKKQESGLRLDSRDHVLNGNDEHDALIDRDNPDHSRLLQVIAWSDDEVRMPPDQALPDESTAILRQWITEGAVWPEESEFGRITDPSVHWKDHWAFQPVSDPKPPGPGHPIDAFIRERLNKAGLSPSPAEMPRILVRRLSNAVVGLPPEIADLETAEQLNTADIDVWLTSYTTRLLASPHFGERWARYWLDVSRYSDTKGYVFLEDRSYSDAWRYREWVISAFNSDMPWDEFLIRQLAADRFPDDQTREDLAAMGFLTLGRRFLNNTQDIIDDRIDVTMRGMMGLTVACARCHDHKFDPVPTADYYSLYGVFDSSEEPKNEPSPLRLIDRPQPSEPVIFVRGSPDRPGEKVPRQFLTAFTSEGTPPFSDGSGRLELARAIASRTNPLTARVAVNRIWSHLFGEPLVDSPSDFGTRSDPPSHPELLDHLALWFMDHDWSAKQLIQYIVTSDTWRQSSRRREEVEAIDPRNRLLARMSRVRLDFEAHRDALLSVSGRLDSTVGGESTDITVRPFTSRRTVYAHIDRQNLPGVFRTFDFAGPDTHAPKRYETSVPQQALFQMNSPFVLEMAAAAAAQEASPEPAASIHALYRRILQRDPGQEEVANAKQFVTTDVPELPSGWSYGYGTINDSCDQLMAFHLLPSFHLDSWRGGADLPDPVLNWATLSKDGGHPGNNRTLCTVRRWTTGHAANVTLRYHFKHPSDTGDGITAIILQNQDRLLTKETIQSDAADGRVENLEVDAGDTIDFVVFCGETAGHDSFESRILIQESSEDGFREWNSVNDFSAQNEPAVTDAWTQLAQVLMLTNEFVFVD